MNKFCRGFFILMGFMWASLPIININEIGSIWQLVIPELLGLYVLYYFVAKPFLIRRKIKEDLLALEEIDMNIGDKGLQISTNGNRVNKSWNELSSILNTPSGIIFYWIDETKNWLPIDTIGSVERYQDLAKFIINKLENNEAA